MYTAAASCLISLVTKESDNNVKLIVLDRLDALRAAHGRVLDSLIVDILQILSRLVPFFHPEFWCGSTATHFNSAVRHKAMSVVLTMTSSRNVVLFLKKQLAWTQEETEVDEVRS
jgi:coatomer subunit beta